MFIHGCRVRGDDKKQMIFSGSHNGTPHFDMVLDGTKTQTRRVNRGKYQVGKSYAIQPCRTCKGIEGYRIVMDRIWKEDGTKSAISESGRKYSYATEICISVKDALAEGDYMPAEFEKDFRELNPKWDGWSRLVFEFHVIEVQK